MAGNQGTALLSSRAIIGSYMAILEKTMLDSWVSGISVEFNSNQDAETYRWLSQTPALREWIGERQAKNLTVNSVEIKNKKYEATLDFLVDDIRRDKTGQIMMQLGNLASRSVTHWNSLLSALILNGDGHTLGLCYDGQDYFDDDHSEGDSGTQQNDVDATDIPALNVTLAAPTAAEMSAAILGMVAYMGSYLDYAGEPINEDAKSFIVMTGLPLFYSPILQACTSAYLVGSTGTADNAIVNGGFKIQPVYNPRLASATTQVWMFRTDSPMKPFIRQNEWSGEVKMLAEGSQYEFQNDAWQMGIKANRGVGYGMWQYAMRATLS